MSGDDRQRDDTRNQRARNGGQKGATANGRAGTDPGPSSNPGTQSGYPAQNPQQQGRSHGGGSIVDDIRRPEVWHYLTLTVGLFVVVGVGYGLTFWLFSELGEFDGTTGELLVAFGSIFGFFLGPVVAIFSGAFTALDAPERDDTTLAVASAVGSVVGFVLMVVVLIVFLALGSDGGGGGGGDDSGGDLPGGLGGTIGLLVGIAVSSAVTVLLTRRLTRRR